MKWFINRLAGAFAHPPEELESGMSTGARALVDAAFEEIDPGQFVDYHAHLLGTGTGDTGCTVHPDMQSFLFHPIQNIRYRAFLSASGVRDSHEVDAQYLDRLVRLVHAFPHHGKYNLLAVDRCYKPDGSLDLEHTQFHVPNDYVFRLVRKHPDLFVGTISIHPYRPDALEELEKWFIYGAPFVKWLPNAMGIDLADTRCLQFYRVMAAMQMMLIVHTGDEHSVNAAHGQHLGNPLHMRAPLDQGVKVIAAHCASTGQNPDLDDPQKKSTPNFDLFLRLMEVPRYKDRLFGDISAMTQINRIGRPLTTMLQRTDLHSRLVNGSDYPLPAVNCLVSTRALVKQGYLTPAERPLLNEIYSYNPLLYDFVLKRTIRAPGTGEQFPSMIFMAHPDLIQWKEPF